MSSSFLYKALLDGSSKVNRALKASYIAACRDASVYYE
jgi:hypothetical protein